MTARPNRWLIAGTPGSQPYPCRCLHPYPAWPHKGRRPTNPNTWCPCWGRLDGERVSIDFCCARPENAAAVTV